MASKTPSIKPARAAVKTCTAKPIPSKAGARTAGRAPRAAAPLRKTAPKPAKAPLPVSAPANKQALLLSLLRSAGGVTVTQMAEATGWQHHTIRGTISGVLRKKMKLNVVAEKADGGSIYRVVESSTKA